jgi:serine/threonine protein kinase
VLKERLAQGGMGEVFRAVAIGEHGFEKPVVVKRVLPAHAGREDLAELFVAEAKLMTRLAHPNIVEVYDFGRGEHKDYYLVLELVDGTDLGRLLRAYAGRGERFPVPLALLVASQVLRGLHHAHTRLAGEGGAIVHRDVSPSNVLLSTEGEVKVADFGVALVQREDWGSSGGVAGKPAYMAPEQYEGRDVDARADVFSVGVVLHQILAGELPFGGDTPEAQQAAARAGVRTPLPALRPEVGAEVEEIVARALAADAGARFPDARAMAQAIEALRDRGQRLASGDDLADAVRAAKRELPAEARRVIALSSPSSAPAADEEPHELTRSGLAGGVGAFTLRFPVRADATTRQADDGAADGPSRTGDRYSKPEPRTERLEIAPRLSGAALLPEPPDAVEPPEAGEPAAAAPARSPAILALVVLAAMALLFVFPSLVRRPPPTDPVRSSTSAAPPPTSAPPAPPSASAPEPAIAVVSAARPAVSAPPPSSRPIAPHPSASAPPTATATAAPSSAECAGEVFIYSTGAWDVTGGPTSVQSPAGPLTWPCGTFALTARSRLDPTQSKSTSLRVQALRRAVFDLR